MTNTTGKQGCLQTYAILVAQQCVKSTYISRYNPSPLQGRTSDWELLKTPRMLIGAVAAVSKHDALQQASLLYNCNRDCLDAIRVPDLTKLKHLFPTTDAVRSEQSA